MTTHTHPLPFRLSPSIHFNTPKEGGEVDPTAADKKPADPIAEAVKAERAKWEREQEQKEAEAAAVRERAEAEKKGEWEKVANDEKSKREQADRRAQMAEVNVNLRDHLAEKHADYLPNAADIMLHIERKLAASAKPDDVRKLIEAEAEAFVKRTPRQVNKGGAGAPPPAGGSRLNLSGRNPRKQGGRIFNGNTAASNF
jgi:hypothetical protein